MRRVLEFGLISENPHIQNDVSDWSRLAVLHCCSEGLCTSGVSGECCPLCKIHPPKYTKLILPNKSFFLIFKNFVFLPLPQNLLDPPSIYPTFSLSKKKKMKNTKTRLKKKQGKDKLEQTCPKQTKTPNKIKQNIHKNTKIPLSFVCGPHWRKLKTYEPVYLVGRSQLQVPELVVG